jgi:hypothetical protein
VRYQVSLGAQVYYVPRYDERLARYLPVTRVHFSLVKPLVTLGHQLVIAPRPSADGTVARDKIGDYWISKDAYEAHRTRRGRSMWRRFCAALGVD